MEKNNSNLKKYQLITTLLLMSLLALVVLLFIRQASAHEAFFEHLDISIAPSSALTSVNPDQEISLKIEYKEPCNYGRNLCTVYPRASSIEWGADNENVAVWNNCDQSGGDDCFTTYVQLPPAYPEWSSVTLTAYYKNIQQDITFTNSQFLYNNGSYQAPQYYNDDFDDDYYDTYYVNQMDQWEEVPIYDGGVRYIYRRPPVGWDPYTCGQFVPTVYGGLTYIPCGIYPWELVLMRHGGWVRHPVYGLLVFYGPRRFELDWSFHFGFSINIFHLFHYNPFYDNYYRVGFHHDRWHDRIFDHCGVVLPRHGFMNKTIREIRLANHKDNWPSRDLGHYKQVRDLTKGKMEEIVGRPFRAYSKKEVHSKLAQIVNFPRGAKSIDNKGRSRIGSIDRGKRESETPMNNKDLPFTPGGNLRDKTRGRIDSPSQNDNTKGDTRTETGQIKRRQGNTDIQSTKPRNSLGVRRGNSSNPGVEPGNNSSTTLPKNPASGVKQGRRPLQAWNQQNQGQKQQTQYRQPEQTRPRIQPQIQQPQRQQPQVQQPQRRQPQVQQPQRQQPQRQQPQVQQPQRKQPQVQQPQRRQPQVQQPQRQKQQQQYRAPQQTKQQPAKQSGNQSSSKKRKP